MSKHIVMDSGGSYMPDKTALKRNWVNTLEHRIDSDSCKQASTRITEVRRGASSDHFLARFVRKGRLNLAAETATFRTILSSPGFSGR